MTDKYNQYLGKFGESEAEHYLKKKRYKILEKNYRGRLGEIDIIAEKKKEIIFVEVKTRKSDKFGKPYEAVDFRKQRKIIICAKEYLAKNALYERNIRFDVIEVYGSFDGGFFDLDKINHIEGAIENVNQF